MDRARFALEPEALRTRWMRLKEDRKLRTRDAAAELGVSEAELVATLCGSSAVRLEGDFRELVSKMPNVLRAMALTRNASCVHEKTGHYDSVSHGGHTGLVLGPDIDLRIFFSHWRHGFALEEPGADGAVRSMQFFDAHGDAVHKIFLRDPDSLEDWTGIVNAFTATDQTPRIEVTPAPPREAPRADGDVDVKGFLDAWSAMRDTHEFFGMLRSHGVARDQALRLADNRFCYRVGNDAPGALLDAVAGTGLSIMVFVGNPGCIQIHTGPIHDVRTMGPWLNVMDPGFNLHLRADHVAQAWVVKKPTDDGIVTSLELFDARGDLIVQFFGARKPGIPEKAEWRELVARLFPEPAGIVQ